MLRTQVQLTEEQDRRLEEIGRERSLSKAELIRRAINRFLAQEAGGPTPEERRQRALAVVGKYRSGYTDTAEHHDAVLAEAYRA